MILSHNFYKGSIFVFMPEVILVVFVFGLLSFPQVGAYFFAKHLGRNPWFWFWISFVLPIISLFILIFLPDLEAETKADNEIN